ncbi:MAG: hypothetical protein MJ252_09740 [archaeon]|nr:hypothetical protein [archaeon]
MDSDDEDVFEFNPQSNFDKTQEKMQTEITNSQNYNLLKELSNNFFTSLASNTEFNHQFTWRGYSTTEPISITINAEEPDTGICDIINPLNEGYFRKIAITFATIFSEVDNLLGNSSLNPFESLFPLVMYNETIETEIEQPPPSVEQSAEQMSKMLNYLRELYDKIINLLSIAVNLCNQLIAFYSNDCNKFYNSVYKNVHLEIGFEYLGLIMAYLNAVDSIVKSKEDLTGHWENYRKIFYKCKNNMAEYNMNEEQKNKLEKLIGKITACLLEKNCFDQCVRNFLKHTGKFSPSTSGHNRITQNRPFIAEMVNYIKKKLTKLGQDIGSLTESNERTHLMSIISLVGVYCKMIESDPSSGLSYDSSLIKMSWNVLQKVSKVQILGNTFMDLPYFLKKFVAFGNQSYYDINALRQKNSRYLDLISSGLNIMVHNLKMHMLTWITRVETDLFDIKVPLFKDEIKGPQIPGHPRVKCQQILSEKNEHKMINILNGLAIAGYLKISLSSLLNYYLGSGKAINLTMINTMCNGLEVIKVTEEEFHKIIPFIAQQMDIMNRTLFNKLQQKLKKVISDCETKRNQYKKYFDYYTEIKEAASIMYSCTLANPSKLRRIILNICLPILQMYDEKEFSEFNTFFSRLQTLNELTREVNFACDCSFMYWYQEVIPEQIKLIYKEMGTKIIFYSKVLTDIERPLLYLIYREDQGAELMKTLRKQILKIIEENFLKVLSNDIEKDLRTQIHAALIEGLRSTTPTEDNYCNILKLPKFKAFDHVIDIKRYVEEFFNEKWYKLTTFNLKDWTTYQQLRAFAKSKYGLNLHQIYLPNQSLDEGKDIITIIRKLPAFTEAYSHNLLSEVFVQKINKKHESNSVSIISVNQILNSLYTNGTGIINSVINSTYQFLKKQLKSIVNILTDDFIVSTLKEERTFWEQNRSAKDYLYPYERAVDVKQKLNKLFGEEIPTKYQLIRAITRIGNAIGLTHCIRTALRDYNSHNSNMIDCEHIEEFGNLVNHITQFEEEETNPEGETQNENNPKKISETFKQNSFGSFKESTSMFINTMSALQETGLNNINYLNLLVSAYGNAFSPEKIKDIDLFIFFFPPACIKHIENLIVAKRNLTMISNKKQQEDAYFCDDGFIIGMVYVLKVFKCDKMFEGLNYFKSVVNKFQKDKDEFDQQLKKTTKKTESDEINQNIKGFQSETYLREFKSCMYTYSSSSILFNE